MTKTSSFQNSIGSLLVEESVRSSNQEQHIDILKRRCLPFFRIISCYIIKYEVEFICQILLLSDV